MPELPELSAVAAYLDERLAGATVVGLQFPTVFALKSKGIDPDKLVGRSVRRVHRRGKFLVFQTSAATDSAEYADEGGALSIVVSFAKAGWLRLSGKLPRSRTLRSRCPGARPLPGTFPPISASATTARTTGWT